jgi:hypothetical protein
MERDASTQISRENYAHEPVHETDPGMRRNHPVLRLREGACHQQHVDTVLFVKGNTNASGVLI